MSSIVMNQLLQDHKTLKKNRIDLYAEFNKKIAQKYGLNEIDFEAIPKK